MEPERLDVLPSFWPACLGFALSQIAVAALMVVLAVSVDDPQQSSIGLRGVLHPEMSDALGEAYPAYVSPTLG